MKANPALGFAVMLLLLSGVIASAKEVPDQDNAANQPIGGGKPVATTTIKRCPDGYELVIRANGRRGCAKDVVPAND